MKEPLMPTAPITWLRHVPMKSSILTIIIFTSAVFSYVFLFFVPVPMQYDASINSQRSIFLVLQIEHTVACDDVLLSGYFILSHLFVGILPVLSVLFIQGVFKIPIRENYTAVDDTWVRSMWLYMSFNMGCSEDTIALPCIQMHGIPWCVLRCPSPPSRCWPWPLVQ